MYPNIMWFETHIIFQGVCQVIPMYNWIYVDTWMYVFLDLTDLKALKKAFQANLIHPNIHVYPLLREKASFLG